LKLNPILSDIQRRVAKQSCLKSMLVCLSISLLPIILSACGLVGFGNSVIPGAATNGPVIVLAAANATPTPTPFQPNPPTPTYLPTNMPTPIPVINDLPEATELPPAEIVEGQVKSWADYPGPSVWPDIEVPAPVGILPQPAGQTNILVLGSDKRPYEGGFRTDAMLLVTLNPSLGKVNVTSFPRDLYVYIPGWTVQRLNTAQVYGGFDLTQMTFEYNFGVRPDHYIMIEMDAFKEVIDSLGGVNVDVEAALTDWRDHYGYYSVNPGTVYMDGETALWYARSRYSSNDLVRNRRQQEVLKAILEKLLSLDAVNRAPELFQVYVQNVTTDLTLEDITPLLPLAASLGNDSLINRFYIGAGQVVNWINMSGAQVLLPIQSAVIDVMRQALNSP
jgi:polyisoprenyl-teichoic acid--peptidoglycan teichoic acid transferase